MSIVILFIINLKLYGPFLTSLFGPLTFSTFCMFLVYFIYFAMIFVVARRQTSVYDVSSAMRRMRSLFRVYGEEIVVPAWVNPLRPYTYIVCIFCAVYVSLLYLSYDSDPYSIQVILISPLSWDYTVFTVLDPMHYEGITKADVYAYYELLIEYDISAGYYYQPHEKDMFTIIREFRDQPEVQKLINEMWRRTPWYYIDFNSDY